MSIKFGDKPFLECSSKGDKRFSAFSARINSLGKTIEELYQAKKVFKNKDGSFNSGFDWREVKGKKALNQQDCAVYYSYLWDLYFQENPDLLDVVMKYSGFSDIFGQTGHCCQAQEIFRIYQTELLRRQNE